MFIQINTIEKFSTSDLDQCTKTLAEKSESLSINTRTYGREID